MISHIRIRARSRLYRSQFLQVNTRLKALDEIYKIYTLLHRSAFKISAKLRQTFSHFHNFIFKISLIFPNSCSKFTNFDEIFKLNFSGISAFFMEKTKICSPSTSYKNRGSDILSQRCSGSRRIWQLSLSELDEFKIVRHELDELKNPEHSLCNI